MTDIKAAKLTNAERNTLNGAVAILQKYMGGGAHWMPYIMSGKAGLSYFTSSNTQFSDIGGAFFADKVQAALDREYAEAIYADGTKARRVAKLRAELEALEGEGK